MDAARLQKLKNQHGPLYQLKVGGTDLVFRELTLGEFSYLADKELTADVAEKIISFAVVYPQVDIATLRVGEIIQIADAVIKESSWGDMDKFLDSLEDKRKVAGMAHPQAVSAICSVFNMKAKEVEAMKMDEFLDYVAKAEVVTGQKIFKSRRGAPRPTITQQHIIPGRRGSKAQMDAMVHEALSFAGIEPSWNSLADRLVSETGKRPMTFEEARAKKIRPPENIPKEGLSKTVAWDKDLIAFVSPDLWPDGATV